MVYSITAGKIVVRGDKAFRLTKKRADYFLFYKENLPLAIVEAKDDSHLVGDGMLQAQEYAYKLDVRFVFTSNGDADMATIRKRQLKNGENAYTIQVKFKDKGNGKTILETTTWRSDTKLTAKQKERAVQNFADDFERQIRETVNGATATFDTPNITFREFAAQWLENGRTQRISRIFGHEESKKERFSNVKR